MKTDHRITAVMALKRARHLVVFTGAGISAESGIPTFRDSDGFWQRFPPEQFANWSGLFQVAMTQPRRFAEFVRCVIDPIARAVPNAGHRAIAAFGQHVQTTVITQNIDGLHQAAGSEPVWEIHGSLLEVVHSREGRIVHQFQREELVEIAQRIEDYLEQKISLFRLVCELAKAYPLDWTGQHRPNLVLFGDSLAEPAWEQAQLAVDACDVLLLVGTSGVVYPAALLPARALAAGATVLSVDPHPAEGCWLEGCAGEVLPLLLRDAFGTSLEAE